MTVFMLWLFKIAGSTRCFPARLGRALVWGFLFGGVSFLPAQEALRASLAGEAAAEARKRAMENAYYNLKAGPLKLRFGTSLGVEATDNVNLSENDPEPDLSVSPGVNISLAWRATDQNELTFAAGLGYTKYLRHSELDHFFITPDSDLSFKINAGDFLIDLHNRFQLTQEAYNQPQVSQTGNYGYFLDTAGIAVDWDLNKIVLTFGYDHEIQKYTPSAYSYQDHSSELLQTRVAYLWNRETRLGLQVGGGITTYDQQSSGTNSSGLSDLSFYNFGPFISSQLTENIGVTLGGGYSVYMLDQPDSFGQSGDQTAYYGSLDLEHRVNDKLHYHFSIGNSVELGVTSSTYTLYYARLEPTWRLIRNVGLRTPIFYEYATQDGSQAETVNRFGAGLEFNYQLTQKLATTASYYYLNRQSDLADQNFIQNRLVLNLHYSF